MKKNNYLIFPIFFLILISACVGYEPIFKSTNVQFKISEYLIEGDKILGNKIYSKLNNLSKSQKDNANSRPISIIINTTKNKKETSKDSAGKILEYKTTINANFLISDYLSNEKILDKNYILSSSYKAHDQYSETIKKQPLLTVNLDKLVQDLSIFVKKVSIINENITINVNRKHLLIQL